MFLILPHHGKPPPGQAGIIACAEAYAMCGRGAENLTEEPPRDRSASSIGCPGQEVYAYGSVLETANVGAG